MSKKKSASILRFLLILVTSATLGYLVGSWGPKWIPVEVFDHLLRSSTGWENALKILLVPLALWAALAVHELGHLLMGLALGFRFQLYVAGFLGLRRNPLSDRVEVFFNRDAQLFGGVAATVPVKKSPDLRLKLAAVVAAGPLSSLGCALLLGIPAYWTSLDWSAEVSPALRLWLVFALVFAPTSALLFLATTLPTRTGAFFSDRGRFFRLIGGGQVAAVEQAVLELMAHGYSLEPYGAIDPQQIALIQSDESPMMQIFAHSLRYYYHLDRGEKDLALTAVQQIEPLLEAQPPTFQAALRKDLVFAYAVLAKDAAKAQEHWGKISQALQQLQDVQTLLAKTALYGAEGNLSEAKMTLAQGLARIPKPVQKYSDRFYEGMFKMVEAGIEG